MALLLLFLLPLLAGVLIPLLPDRPGLARGVALVAPVLQLITAAWLWRHPPGDLVVEWLPRLGLVLELGLDGLSLPLVLLTALLTALAVLASPEQQSRPRLFFSLMLATNLGLVGSFLARNALLFVLAMLGGMALFNLWERKAALDRPAPPPSLGSRPTPAPALPPSEPSTGGQA